MNSFSKLTFFDRKILLLDKTSSTNDYIKELNPTEPTAILAEYQTNGRGQREKYWESNPNENILISFSIPIDISAQNVGFLIYKLSIHLYLFINEILSENGISNKVELKWPNDIILMDKKIMGILLESSISGDKVNKLIIGIGLNVLQTNFLNDNPRAGSLKSIFPDKNWDRYFILVKLIEKIEVFTKENEFINLEIQKIYNEILYKRNQEINIENKGKFINLGIDLDGRLKMKNIDNDEILNLNSTKDIRWDY